MRVEASSALGIDEMDVARSRSRLAYWGVD
jgi:hypothetical protein